MKIIGATVGTSLPKPNFDQTDPKKGDYIKGDRSFLRIDDTLTESGISADAKATGDAINLVQANIDRVTDLIGESSVADQIAGKADAEHDHNDVYYTEAEIDNKLSEKVNIADISGLAETSYVDSQDASVLSNAKAYTDAEIALLMNNSSEAVDSIMELAAAMAENKDVVAALESAIGKKVDKVEGMGLSSNDFTDEEKVKLNSPVPTDNVVHGESQELLSNILETYILAIDYSPIAFDVTEIVFDTSSEDGGSGSDDPSGTTSPTNAILGYAVLGQMVLG